MNFDELKLNRDILISAIQKSFSNDSRFQDFSKPKSNYDPRINFTARMSDKKVAFVIKENTFKSEQVDTDLREIMHYCKDFDLVYFIMITGSDAYYTIAEELSDNNKIPKIRVLINNNLKMRLLDSPEVCEYIETALAFRDTQYKKSQIKAIILLICLVSLSLTLSYLHSPESFWGPSVRYHESLKEKIKNIETTLQQINTFEIYLMSLKKNMLSTEEEIRQIREERDKWLKIKDLKPEELNAMRDLLITEPLWRKIVFGVITSIIGAILWELLRSVNWRILRKRTPWKKKAR